MGLLDKLWDDVIAGPQPEQGLGRLRKDSTAMDDETMRKLKTFERTRSSPTQGIYIKPPPVIRSSSSLSEDSVSSLSTTPTSASPLSPSTMSALASPSAKKDNVWRSVFHPGSGSARAMEKQGSARFDNVTPNSPSIYDWMYSPDSKVKYR